MPRRIGGKKYLVDTINKEIHDLDNEQHDCQINAIIELNHDVYYDTLEQAQKDGFGNDHLCLNRSK